MSTQTIALKPTERMVPIHPGEFLRDDFLVPLALTPDQLASELHIPGERVAAITEQRRGLDADTALRLAIYFDTTAEYWMNMQQQYELSLAARAAQDSFEKIQKRPG